MFIIVLESISVSILILLTLSVSGLNRGLFVRGRKPLPIDGHWNSWGPWSECYLNSKDVKNFYQSLENFHIQSRNRTCDNPKPINGGEDCESPTHRFKQCSCMNPLGMETNLIADSQISSTTHYDVYSASQGRIGDQYNSWCSKKKESHFNKIYLEIDFGKFANVAAIEMEGSNKNGRVTRYSLEYSLNGKNWEKILPKLGFKGQFKGNLVPGKVRANFSRNKVMKHLRVIPMKSFGDYPCLKIEPFGCMYTCGEVLTSDFGRISGNSRVDIDQNCLWRIELLNTSALSFDFTIFDILCEHGYLNIHDGSYDFIESPVIEHLCLQNRDQDFAYLLKINTNKVWLNFVSNSSDFEDSFTLKYFGECTQTLNLFEGKPKKIESPNFPNNYFGNMDCSWTIAAPGVNTINLMFSEFSIESNSKSCPDDSLTIKYYQGDQEKHLGVFCNDNIPQKNYSLFADLIRIHFKTDPIYSEKGFSISVQSGKKLLPTERDMIPENPTTSLETSFTSESPYSNDTFGTRRKDKKTDSGSDWTIITISAFSAVVVLLLLWVIGNNIRRCINNRNEVEAHCAKVKALNEEKVLQEQKRASQAERLSFVQSPKHKVVMVSPKRTFSSPPIKTMSPIKTNNDLNNVEELHDSIDGELSPLMSTPEHNSTISRHETVSLVSETNSLHSGAEVDLPRDYNESIQVHSPNKQNSISDLSIKDGNNSDVESCV